jgi:hypothetical protein
LEQAKKGGRLSLEVVSKRGDAKGVMADRAKTFKKHLDEAHRN